MHIHRVMLVIILLAHLYSRIPDLKGITFLRPLILCQIVLQESELYNLNCFPLRCQILNKNLKYMDVYTVNLIGCKK